jgi:hypothetical protein
VYDGNSHTAQEAKGHKSLLLVPEA